MNQHCLCIISVQDDSKHHQSASQPNRHQTRTRTFISDRIVNNTILLLILLIVINIVQSIPITTKHHDPDGDDVNIQSKINEFINEYELAHYDPRVLRRHAHSRRSTRATDTGPLRFSIQTKDRTFHLILNVDNTIFSNDVEIVSTGSGRRPLDTVDAVPSVYSGRVEDDDRSSVEGVVTREGLFDGTITTDTDVYYIEPLHRYHPPTIVDDDRNPYHSVIYKTSSVTHPTPLSSVQCASHRLHLTQQNQTTESSRRGGRRRRWLQSTDNTISSKDKSFIIIGSNTNIYNNNNNNNNRKASSIVNTSLFNRTLKSNHSNGTLLYDISESLYNTNSLVKNKRGTAGGSGGSTAVDPNKTTCMLYLQADHQFYQKYKTEEACIEVMTRHVQRVNAIYKITDFNQDGVPDNITFMIKRIKVYTTDAINDSSYRFPNNYGVEKFLEIFSEEDYDAFCLAYMFTYRDFEMGTLGLAWTGDLKNAGGVCEKNGHYRGSLKSLNTGIITLLNYGKHVPPAVSHVTLAHEIGHNFGSPHDPEICTPGGEDGNYIMFARATSGDKKNNNQFSICSLKSINPVLNYKARSIKNGCFTVPQTSLCGNGVVEDNEECDCGWEDDCTDKCCNPQRRHFSGSLGGGEDGVPCTLTRNSVCSPSQGPCCTAECELRFGDKCRDDNGCRSASHCNGLQAHCPPSVNKPNKTICNDEFVCYMGECTGSICLAYGLESCQCVANSPADNLKACELCCKLPGNQTECKSSFEWNQHPYDIPDMYSKPGTPCNNYNGYCDVFQKCREVDPSGPLATLRKLLLADDNYKNLFVHYWYIIVFALFILLFLLVVIVKLFGRTQNQKLKSITTVIHHHQHQRQHQYHQRQKQKQKHPSNHRSSRKSTSTEDNNVLGTSSATASARDQHNEQQDVNSKDVGGATNKNVKQINHPVIQTKLMLKRKLKYKNGSKKLPANNAVGGGRSPTKVNNKTEAKAMMMVTTAAAAQKKKKKTIDYSTQQQQQQQKKKKDNKKNSGSGGGNMKKTLLMTTDCDGNNTLTTTIDPVNKVQNWLMKSQAIIPKSLSTPAALSNESKHHNHDGKSKSIGQLATNLNQTQIQNQNQDALQTKKRLQVIYKPPFKFSVKFNKSSSVGGAGGALRHQQHGRSKSSRSNRVMIVNKKGGGSRQRVSDTTRHNNNALIVATTNNTFSTSNNNNNTSLLVHSLKNDDEDEGGGSRDNVEKCRKLNDEDGGKNINTNILIDDTNNTTVQSDLEVLLSESD